MELEITKNIVIEHLRNKQLIELKKILNELDSVEVAELMSEIESDVDALILFRMLPKIKAVDVFTHLSIEAQLEMINIITDIELNEVMSKMFFDEIIDIIEEMPAEMVDKVLKNIPPDKRRLVNQFLAYPDDSAGSLMTIEFVQLRQDMTVGDSLAYIRKIGMKKETIYTCYVTNRHRKLLGIVSLRALVTENPEKLISEVMQTDFVWVNTFDDQELVAEKFRKYGFLAIPVVDKELRLTGIITVDDVIDVIETEATEDFHKMAAMEPSDKEYLNTSIFDLSKQRILWLMILMVSATVTGSIIKKYSDTLESVIVLSMFIPMLMDTGGNAGSQSSTLIIRGMATGEIKLNDFFRVFKKEFGVSLLCGVTLAIVNFIRIMVFEDVGVLVALTISITLITTVIMSKLVGGILPIMAKKVHLDPAIMAGPLITTIVDAVSLIIYFKIAHMMLGIGG